MTHQPNQILCWDTQEGFGTITKDNSRSALHGTLTNGPAWTFAPTVKAIAGSTNTSVDMGDKTLSFSATPTVEVVSAATSLFDFSNNLPYVIAFSFQRAATLSANQVILSHTDGSTGVGWAIYMETDGHWVVAHVGAANSSAGGKIQDINPHRFLVARDVGNLYVYIDGKIFFKEVGHADMSSSANQPFGLAHMSVSAAGAWGGKAGNVAIWNFFPGPNQSQVDVFAWNDYVHQQGSGSVSTTTDGGVR